MFEVVPDTVVVAGIAVTGILVGAAFSLIGHLLISRAARRNRVWASVWPEKAKAYESLLEWSQESGSLTDDQVWVQAQIYASKQVRGIIDDYQKKKDLKRLQSELGPAVRDDLGTNIRLK